MTDAEEFASIPRPPAPPSDDPDDLPRQARIIVAGKDPSPTKQDDQPGKLTQWASFMTGYKPMTKTTKGLAPGVYSVVVTNMGDYMEPRNVVTDNLMRLPDSKSDMVIDEIQQFWKLKPQFKKHGFSFKRGILMYGPPGSGKTSTVAFIQQEIVRNGGIAVLGSGAAPTTLSTMLQHLREIEPERPVVVILEDIDATIKTHGEQEVLALLDGESSISDCVYIATTNYPERLDPRVTSRPSRFDTVIKIGMPNAAARLLYLEHCGVPGDLESWVELSEGFSIAHLKEVVVGVCCFGRRLEDVIEKVRGMIEKPLKDDLGVKEKKVGF